MKENCSEPTDLPCLTELLEEMLFKIVQVLEKHKVVHWITYGTLLGLVRDDRIIPWTIDNDIAIFPDKFNRSKGQKYHPIHNVIANTLKEEGYYYFQQSRVCIPYDSPKYSKFAKFDQEMWYYVNHYPYTDMYVSSNFCTSMYLTLNNGPFCFFSVMV